MAFGSLILSANEFKMYNVKSGIVTYKIEGGGEIMGSKQTRVGKERLIFDKYGYRELKEESIISVINVFGNKQKDKSHKITLRVGDKAQVADFKKKRIMQMQIPNMSMIASQNKNLSDMSKELLKSMGGKVIGQEKIAGYKCDVWQTRVGKQCIYKGVPLKIETNIMGIKQVSIAVDAKFDIDIDESKFKLPNFKVENSMPLPQGANINPQDMQKMMKQLGELANNKNSKISTDDIANALGGAMLPQMKKDLLSQESAIKEARVCFKNSNSLKDANRCEKEFSKKINEPSQPFNKWDEQTKKQTLDDIDGILKSMDCVKKANTIREVRKCQM